MAMLQVFILSLAGGVTLAAVRAPLWTWALTLVLITSAADIGLLGGKIEVPTLGPFEVVRWFFAAVIVALCIPALRRRVLVAPAFEMIRRAQPRVSNTARQALE